MRTLLVSREARGDLLEIWDFSADAWGEAQADRYLDAIDSALHDCRHQPERGRRRDDLRPGHRSMLVGRHLIFYTFDHRQVVVQRVLHASMDPDRHLPGSP